MLNIFGKYGTIVSLIMGTLHSIDSYIIKPILSISFQDIIDPIADSVVLWLTIIVLLLTIFEKGRKYFSKSPNKEKT